MLPHVRKVDLFTNLRFDIASHLAVSIIIDTTLIDRFIREIFPSEHNVMSWQSPPGANSTRIQQKDKEPNKQDVYYVHSGD